METSCICIQKSPVCLFSINMPKEPSVSYKEPNIYGNEPYICRKEREKKQVCWLSVP